MDSFITHRNYSKVTSKNNVVSNDKENDGKYLNIIKQDFDTQDNIPINKTKKNITDESLEKETCKEEQTEMDLKDESQERTNTSLEEQEKELESGYSDQELLAKLNESNFHSNGGDNSLPLNNNVYDLNESFANAINKTIIKYNASCTQFLQIESDKSMILFDDETVQSCQLAKWRNRLANVCLTQGSHLPADKEYSFFLVLGLLFKALGTCCLALVYLFCNLLPCIEIILHIVRFIFDRAIDIKKSRNTREILSRTITSIIQLIIIYFFFILMFNFLTLPIIKLATGIFSKLIFFK